MAKKRKAKKKGPQQAVFRSRIAASWGAFFERLGIEYEYRQKVYTLGENKIRYRHTFYIPAWDKFVELREISEPLDRELFETWGLLVSETEKTLLAILGYAEPGQYNIVPFIPHYKEEDGVEKCTYGVTSQELFNTFSYGTENNQLYFLMLTPQDIATQKFQRENNFPLWLKWEIREDELRWLKPNNDSLDPLDDQIHTLIGSLDKVQEDTPLTRAYRAAGRVRH